MTCNNEVSCKSDSGLECTDGTCQCSSPKSWDADAQKCDKCIKGFTKMGSGTPCSLFKIVFYFLYLRPMHA